MALIEVAMYGVAHLLAQLGNGLALRDDRLSKSASREPTLGSLLDNEDDLVHLDLRGP